MIVFKTEIKNMPNCCNYCSFRHICKPELNLSPRDTKQIVPMLEYCPLIEIPDPKPELTLTQHEHDLIQIIKKAYPNTTYIIIYSQENSLYLIINNSKGALYYQEEKIFEYTSHIKFDLFDKYKLPTLLSEFTDNIGSIKYNIVDLLSLPIRKEPK